MPIGPGVIPSTTTLQARPRTHAQTSVHQPGDTGRPVGNTWNMTTTDITVVVCSGSAIHAATATPVAWSGPRAA